MFKVSSYIKIIYLCNDKILSTIGLKINGHVTHVVVERDFHQNKAWLLGCADLGSELKYHVCLGLSTPLTK